MFSLASTLISAMGSAPVKKAYEKGLSIWEARDELDKLAETIETIKGVLLDAEQRQESNDGVKSWIKRVRDVLYDADDLFDEVTIDEMLNRQTSKEGNPLKKVRAYCFKLNLVVSRNSIANQVKDIRKRLLAISTDMAQFNFVIRLREEPISNARQGQETWSFVDSKEVVGRDEEKKAILEFLLKDQSIDNVSVTAIVGIGGMGKTTLAQLVYNDKEVQKRFENRWYACISDTSNDKEVIGKIFQSIYNKSYGDVHLDHLQTEIRKSVENKKFLLVLDDVWDEDHDRWMQRMSLLRSGAVGSKIIVTARSSLVAKALGALEAQTRNLKGLSESESWDLFQSVAFPPEQEKDPRQVDLGRDIVKQCRNVPLVIRSVANLLYNKDTIEWESFKENELSKVKLSRDPIMETLMLSYDHLPSYLKPCFAYCSLFPKDHVFFMDDLIRLWTAQGYIIDEMQTVEQAGYSYFMDLHRRCFFEKSKYWENYKMHDVIHDLAQCIAGEEITMLTMPPTPTQLNKRARHVIIGPDIDTSHMLNTNRLRSLFFLPRLLSPQFTYGKRLRALILSDLKIQTVSSCIGELKHLRYLNLSKNPFKSLPDSLTNLLNLLTLNIGLCNQLKALPNSFSKLTNLRHLNICWCFELKHMPTQMGKLSCLQELSNFKVGKAIERVQSSGLDVLAGLKLRGVLRIDFERDINNWDGDECWKLPVSLEEVHIQDYPGRRIPHWSNYPSLLPNLSYLHLYGGPKVKYLPPLRCLPNLKTLRLCKLEELEYIEEEGEEDNICTTVAGAGCINNNATFFPVLEQLHLEMLPRLKGWRRRKVEATTASAAESASPHPFLSFPLLFELEIQSCSTTTSFPLCPCVRILKIREVRGMMMQHLLLACSTTTSTSTGPSSSLERMDISRCFGLTSIPAEALTSLKICHIYDCLDFENLHLTESPPLLEYLRINSFSSFVVEALPSLVSLDIVISVRLKNLRIAHLNALQKFKISSWGDCKNKLDIWGLQNQTSCVDWDSLPNISEIVFSVGCARCPSPEELPDCLRRRQALGLSIEY